MATKTTTVTFRMAPDVKETLCISAEKERRSIANMIEVMILEYAKNAKKTGRAVVGLDQSMKISASGKTRKIP